MQVCLVLHQLKCTYLLNITCDDKAGFVIKGPALSSRGTIAASGLRQKGEEFRHL